MAKNREEQPKEKIAKQVITPKRRYFFPHGNVSVEADDLDDASKQAKKHKKDQEVGDDNS